MKFTSGHWEMRPGVKPHYAEQAYEVNATPDNLTIYAATRRVANRGDTLNYPILTVQLSSPMPDVIGVRLFHHKGVRPVGPSFELYPQPGHGVEIRDDEEAATLRSGHLTARVEKAGDWRLDFMDGERVITSTSQHGMGYMET